MDTTIERLYDGLYECPSCEVEYAVDRATEEDLFCEECGGDLVPVEGCGAILQPVVDGTTEKLRLLGDFIRLFKANLYDDAPLPVTMILPRSVADDLARKIETLKL